MSKQKSGGHPRLFYGLNSTRRNLMKGVNLVYYSVSHTLSPKGSNSLIVLPGYNSPLITNDGATIAKSVSSVDPSINAGCDLIKEVALKSNEIAGDGTTTSIILARNLIKNCYDYLLENPNKETYLAQQLRQCKNLVKDWINSGVGKQIESMEDIKTIACVSSGSEEVGELIKEAYEKVGKNGLVISTTSNTIDSQVSVRLGYKWENGHLRQELITNPKKMETVMEDESGIYILLYKGKINVYPQKFIPVLQAIIQSGRKLLILAEDFNAQAYAPMLATRTQDSISIVGVKAPGFGERTLSLMQDISSIANTPIYESLEDVKLEQLGTVKKVSIGLASTTIVGSSKASELVEAKVNELRELRKSATTEYDKSTLDERISMMTVGVAEIQVGAVTETELKDKKLRIEDALCAVKAAIESGYTAGGGLPYLLYREFISDKVDRKFYDIISRVYESPIAIILRNCGVSDIVAKQILNLVDENTSFGYNATTGKTGYLLEEGVIDPVKVVEQAIINSLSIAEMAVTANSIIIGGYNNV